MVQLRAHRKARCGRAERAQDAREDRADRQWHAFADLPKNRTGPSGLQHNHSGTLMPSGASTWGHRGSESPLRSDRVGAGVEPTAALPIMVVPRGRRAIARAWVLETGGQRWLSM